ncbi:MAG: hypothetical protein QNJ31_06495 [Candidatus Caenarcaniphilales bacterium]|nr:hypothetical protein [Candidatus Caenarcaniphilales bacterium]
MKFSSQKLFKYIVVIPFVIATFYFVLIAESKYASNTKLIVQSGGNSDNLQGAIPLLSLGNLDSNYKDALLLEEYIKSESILKILDEEFNLKKRYGKFKIDPLSRIWILNHENFLNYYQKQVKIQVDETSNVFSISFLDPSPKFSQNVLKRIVLLSEEFINRISKQIAKEQQQFAESELEEVQSRLTSIKDSIKEFQDRHNIVSPERDIQSTSAILSSLEAQLVKEQIALKQARAYLSDKSFEVKSKLAIINELRQKIEFEKSQLADEDGNSEELINDVYLEYQTLLMEAEFLKDLYKTSLAHVESIKKQSIQQIKFLVQIQSPTLPEAVHSPKRLYYTIVTLLILSLVYGIVRLTLDTIQEHKN